ncbi:MAG: MATE family efflux transporter [Clostridiaceae bacterium]|nr:MATE family efflux transporter [Clostridiaceae bacterium]
MQISEIKRLSRVVGKITLPVLVEQFFVVIMGVINTMLASNLGKTAISSIGMIDSISNIIVSLFAALALGGTVTVAQYTGHQDRDSANQTAAQAVLSSLVISGVVTITLALLKKPLLIALYGEVEPIVWQNAMDYLSIALWSYIPISIVSVCFGILRGAGDTRTPMTISIWMNVLNVIFSYILIYGVRINFDGLVFQLPGYGVRGAAAGLALARVIGMILVLIPLIRGSKKIVLNNLHAFKLRWDLLRCIFILGIPASAEQLMFQGGRLVTQTFIARLGTDAMAANTITTSINNISLIPGQAIAIAATAIIGRQIGAHKNKEAKQQLTFLVVFSSIAMGLASLFIFITKNGFIQLYTQDPQIMRLASLILSASLLVQPLVYSTSFVIPAGLRGAGDIRYTMIVSIISMWVLRIFLGYIFSVILPWGVLGVWIGMFIDWFGRSILFIRRMSHQEWMHRAVFQSRQLNQDPEI